MNKFMKEAIAEASFGIHNGHGGPFGCVIVKNDQIVGRGHNSVLLNNDPTCHGEIMAIHEACKKLKTFDLRGCELYTTGEPCPMCLGAILWANIDKIYYGCNIVDTEKVGFRDQAFYDFLGKKANGECDIMEEMDREECLKLYDDYASISSKKNY
ncbi:MAG: nucleoside deaminase [Bacilli bacterium]|nr:nucleoside deaminase [Bacilli bacterium]